MSERSATIGFMVGAIGLTICLALAFLCGCSSQIERVDATGRAESWGRHHGRVLAGPRVTWCNGVQVGIEAGRQFPVYAPGEPHVSSRAPSGEWQLGVQASVPLYRRK